MGRISNTITLAKASWQVLKADKELVALPVISLVATLIVAFSFLAPIAFATGGQEFAAESMGTGDYILLGLMYVSLAFVTIFFNAALVSAAMERMDGGDPTIGSAIRGALGRIHRILPWAIVSATVSVILRALEERAGTLGRIVIGIIGVAWSLVTFLVVPVLVVENVGVTDAVKRSGALFKKTWGENVAAQVGFGLLGFLVVLPAILIAAGAFYIGETIGLLVLVLAVVWILGASMVIAALNGVFQAALYRYAAGLETPSAFGSLEATFAPKAGRGIRGGFAGA
ncbi:MAG TPA: DUF6159 family protein [Acidimicrobiia bacterium]|nr:DUF6159 family protein [Acidimicrobiia bacterium]